MKTTFSLLLFVFFFCSTGVYAQFVGPNSNWYFGAYAGLTWNVVQSNGDPMYLMDSQVLSNEGIATISDASGNLLFYTNGVEAWNTFHQPMTNSLASSLGGNLSGNISSTQSALIVPKPLDPMTYYIFTTDAGIGTGGLAYSKVDLTMNAGLGNIDLNEKNITLFTPSTEKVAAVYHTNGLDIWVVAHAWNSNQFQAFLVNSNGVNDTLPVVSNVGSVHGSASSNARGYMKIAPWGNKLVVAVEGGHYFELFDFNKTTGQVSNPIQLQNLSLEEAYGVEFSPSEQYLYGSERWGTNVWQWDISSGISSTINASCQSIAILGTSAGGALQLGPDQKICLARDGTKYLGRINSPDQAGMACNYVDQAVLLGSNINTARDSEEGLPNLMPPGFFVVGPIEPSVNCNSDTVAFSVPFPIDMACWNFNYPTSDANYILCDTQQTASFVFDTAGIYDIQLITFSGSSVDTFYSVVYFSQASLVDLGPDLTICAGDSLVYDLSFNDINSIDGACDYFWESNIGGQQFFDTSAQFSITQAGVYTVTVVSDSICGSAMDNIVVSQNSFSVDLGDDITSGYCLGDSIHLDATNPYTIYGPTSYLWTNGSSLPSAQVFSNGVYGVSATYGNCSSSDSINILFELPITNLDLGTDTTVCPGHILECSLSNFNYSWSTGDTVQGIPINQSGNYSLTVENACGSISDEILVDVVDLNFSLGMDTVYVQAGVSVLLQSGLNNVDFLWSDGSTDSVLLATQEGLYSLTVSYQQACEYSDSVLIFWIWEVPEIVMDNGILLYPNPAKDGLHVNGLTQNPKSMAIYSSSGQLIHAFKMDEFSVRINVSDLPNGQYFLKLETDDGILSKKFIIKR